ncbi:MAG: hypothetical protein EBS34_13415, partial [Flavobacteriales bacterium]|nr:hypothetical protein [Flavobacteriales bacterium]
MSFPPNLLYHLDRLQGFSTSQVLLQPQNKNSATSSDVIQLQIPSNTIFNFRSLKMHFNFQTSGTSLVRAPENVASFIERIEVNMGGNILNPGSNFINVFTNAKRAVMSDQTQNIGDSCLSHPRMVRATSYVDGVTFSISGESYTTGSNGLNTGETCFALEQFEGFISSIQPYLFSTDLVPQITIRLYMSSNNILSVSNTTTLGKATTNFADTSVASTDNNAGTPTSGTVYTGATYTLSDIVFTAEVINLADSTYDNMIASMMNEQGFLECPFKNYNSFIDTFTGTSRFSTATSSLDRIWVVFRGASYNVQSSPLIIEGYKSSGGWLGATSGANSTTVGVGIPQFDVGGTCFDGNEERY